MASHAQQGGGTSMTEAQREAKTNEIAMFLGRAGVNFAKRHYVLTSTWILGLILLQFATGFAPSETSLKEYGDIMDSIDDERLMTAQENVWNADRAYYASKGWFSCDAACNRNYNRLKKAQRILDEIKAQDAAVVAEAKSKIGIYSDVAVQETRDLFWSTFSKGKAFAKRSSWYDMIFMSLGSMHRDESFFSVLIRWLFQLAINFTLGLIGAFTAFVWYLWDVVTSYKPDSFSALLFFALATITAFSVVATYLVGLYAATAGTAYVVVKTVGPNMRIGDGGRARRQYIRHQQGYRRPHYQ